MRKLDNYVRKYGPEFGPKLYHVLQSQAAHAGVSARLRKKIAAMKGEAVAPAKATNDMLPLFANSAADREDAPLAVGA